MADSVTIHLTPGELRALLRRSGTLTDRGFSFPRQPGADEDDLIAALKLIDAEKGLIGAYPVDVTFDRAAIGVLIQRLLPKAVKAKGRTKPTSSPTRRSTSPRKPRPSELRKRRTRQVETEPPLPMTLDDDDRPGDEDRES